MSNPMLENFERSSKLSSDIQKFTNKSLEDLARSLKSVDQFKIESTLKRWGKDFDKIFWHANSKVPIKSVHEEVLRYHFFKKGSSPENIANLTYGQCKSDLLSAGLLQFGGKDMILLSELGIIKITIRNYKPWWREIIELTRDHQTLLFVITIIGLFGTIVGLYTDLPGIFAKAGK